MVFSTTSGPSIVYSSLFVNKNILIKRIEFVNEVFFGEKRHVLDACINHFSDQVVGGQEDGYFFQCHFRGFGTKNIHIHNGLDLSNAEKKITLQLKGENHGVGTIF